MIQIIHRWEVERKNQAASLTAWEKTTKSIRETTEGVRGSVCIINKDRPTEIVTMAKWDELDQWRQFVKTAKSATVR